MAQEYTNSGLDPNQRQSGNPDIISGRVFTRFDPDRDIVKGRDEKVTRGMWSGNVGTLSTFFTQSALSSTQKQYYQEVMDISPSSVSSETQFYIAYGHIDGSGSLGLNEDSPTKAIYYQWKQLLLPSTQERFAFNSIPTNHVYVVSLARQRFRDNIDPGSWEMTLASLSSATGNDGTNTGSNISVPASPRFIKLIDDSGDSAQNTGVVLDSYNIVSGSLASGIKSPKTYYGTVYPSNGVMILNADAFNQTDWKMHTVTGSNINGDNAMKLFKSMSGSSAISTNNGFKARSAENVSSTYYFVRALNAEYNFTNNPSFSSGSNGEFTQQSFVGDPKVYITTVGIYDDNQDLLAVAKLSKPRLKTFTQEATIKVKIDY